MTRSHSSLSHRKSLARRRGFDSHAFAVGRATGVRINGSYAAIHGAALHRSSSRRTSFNGNSSNYRSRSGKFSGRRMKIVNSDNQVATNVSTIGIIFVIIIGVMIIFFLVMMVIMMLNIFSIFKL